MVGVGCVRCVIKINKIKLLIKKEKEKIAERVNRWTNRI